MSGIQSLSVSAAQSYATASPQTQQSLQPFANLDLTEAQRTQLRSVFASAKQNGTSQADVQKQVSAVLTPAQQQTLAADIKAGAGRGHHHHHESSSSTADASSSASDSTTATAASTPSSTLLATITNIQNQAAAAASAVTSSLQDQVLATNGNGNASAS